MYKEFYQFKTVPFSIAADPAFVLETKNFQEGFVNLLYGLDKRDGPIIMTGEIGSGKTTLCNMLLQESLQKDEKAKTAVIYHPIVPAREILNSILNSLDSGDHTGSAHDELELMDMLFQSLKENNDNGCRSTLIVDDAHLLSINMLEYICFLSNMEESGKKLLQIILLSQPEINQKLALKQLRQLNQRISVRFRLYYLNRKETGEYIIHRLKIADGSPDIRFTSGAISKIYSYSRGCQRVINHICDRALLKGSVEKKTVITTYMIGVAVRSLKGDDPDSPDYFPIFFQPWKMIGLKYILGLFVVSVTLGVALRLSGNMELNTEQPPPVKSQPVVAAPVLSQPDPEVQLQEEPAPEQVESVKITAVSSQPDDEKLLRELLYQWIDAWERKDLERYVAFYSEDFYSTKKRNRKSWRAAKQKFFYYYRSIIVKPEDVHISVKGNKGEIRYIQRFYGILRHGTFYEDRGVKRLVWKKEEMGWKIIRESWKIDINAYENSRQ